MPVQSLVVIERSGSTLFLKTFNRLSHAASFFSELNQNLLQQYNIKDSTKNDELVNKNTILVGDVIVVSQQVADVIICIGGQDEIDEPILGKLVDFVAELLLATLEGKISAALLANFEFNAKFALAIDEMMPQGIIECLNVDAILKMTKLKSI